MPDEDDRPRDTGAERGAAGAAGPDHGVSWADLVVPDDISGLSEDVAAYYRERRAARRKAYRDRLLSPRGVRPALLIGAVLLLAGTVTTLLTVLSPQLREPAPSAAPLAASTGSVGAPGGLLPNVTLTAPDGYQESSRGLRPAVLALLPANCGCTPLVESLAQQAAEVNYPLDMIAPTALGKDSAAAALPSNLHAGSTSLWYDANGRLAKTYGGQGIVLVLLRDNGLVFDTVPGPTLNDHQLSGELQRFSTTAEVSG